MPGNDDIDQFDEEGNSALHRAVKADDLLTVSKLLRLGATQTVNEASENPLMCAIRQAEKTGNLAIITLLLNKGTEEEDFELTNNEGKNILHLICETGNVELLMKFLNNEKYNKSLCQQHTGMKDNDGLMPLQYAKDDKFIDILKQIQTSEFKEGHNRLMQYVRALGYEFENDGICFGLSHMGMQALLSKEMNVFNERLSQLMEYKENELADKVSQAREKYQQYSIEFMAEVDAAEKSEKITKAERNAYLKQLNIHEAEKAGLISKEERILLEIPAFIEGLLLYFQPSHYPDVFASDLKSKEKASAFAQDGMLSAPFALSEKIEEQGGLDRITSFSGIYDNDELVRYFKSLKDSLKNADPSFDHPIALALCNTNHAITIGYDNENDKRWVFIDANHMPATYYSTAEEIVEKIKEAFDAGINNSVSFKTEMYQTKENSAKLTPIVQAWENTTDFKLIHTASLEKLNRFDSTNAHWLGIAAKSGYIEEVKALLAIEGMKKGYELCLLADLPEEGPSPGKIYLSKDKTYTLRDPRGYVQQGIFPKNLGINFNDLENKLNDVNFKKAILDYTSNRGLTRLIQNEALLSAAEWGRTEVVKALLSEGIDPNMECGTGITPLFIAARNGHAEVVEALLKVESIKPFQANKNGETALSIAKERGFERVVKALESKENSSTLKRKKPLTHHYKIEDKVPQLQESNMVTKLEHSRSKKNKS